MSTRSRRSELARLGVVAEHGAAAVDGDDRAAHEARLEQEGDDVRDLLGRPDPAERVEPRDRLGQFGP